MRVKLGIAVLVNVAVGTVAVSVLEPVAVRVKLGVRVLVLEDVTVGEDTTAVILVAVG